MKTFKSLEELIAYTKKCNEHALEKVGKVTVDIMKDVTQQEVYDSYNPSGYKRTGDIISCIGVTSADSNHVEVKWQDNGSWTSYAGNHMYAPIGLEMGKTYGKEGYRPKTNLEERATEKVEQEAPDEYKRIMKSKGFKVK